MGDNNYNLIPTSPSNAAEFEKHVRLELNNDKDYDLAINLRKKYNIFNELIDGLVT